MSVRTNTTAMGALPVLVARQVNVRTSATPSTPVTLLNMAATLVGTQGQLQAQLTFTDNHEMRVGDVFVVSGSATAPTVTDGTFAVSVVVSAKVLRFITKSAIPGGGISGDAVSVRLASLHAQQALLLGGSANDAANPILFGPSSNCGLDSLAPSADYTIQTPSGAKFDLADWYISSGA